MNPLERAWYRAADFVQWPVHRVAPTRAGRFVIWLGPILYWLSILLLRIGIKTLVWMLRASIVVGAATLYLFLSMCLGRGAIANGVKRGNGG